MRTLHRVMALIGISLFLVGCGTAMTSYLKQDGAWSAVQRVAVLPFNVPSENPVQRELITELFSQELRKTGTVEVIEIPLNSPVGSGLMDIKQVGKEYKVDAILVGSIDDTRGTVIHLNVQDVATEEVLWSGTYMLGGRAEFFSFTTQQQQFQKGFRRLCERFVGESGVKAPTK